MNSKVFTTKFASERKIQQPQSLPVVYVNQNNEEEEGGLDFGRIFAAAQRRVLIIAGVTAVFAATAFNFTSKINTNYRAKFEILVTPETVENKLTSSPLRTEEPKQEEGVDETELRIIQSPQIMAPVAQELEKYYPGTGIPKLDFNLVKGTNVLEVSYQDPDPRKVALVLDLVSQAYLKYSLESRQTNVRQGIEFVEQQLPQLQQRVATLEEQLQLFRQQYSLVDPQTQGQQLSAQLSGVVQQRLDAQTQLARYRSLYTSLQNQLQLQPSEAMAASALSEAPRYQKLLDQLQELESKIAVDSAKYQEDSPQIQALRDQQQNLLPLIEQEGRRVAANKVTSNVLQSRTLASPDSLRQQQTQQFFEAAGQINALEAQNQALLQAENILRQQIKQFPLLIRKNDDLVRQINIATENLNQFVSRREALRIDAAQKQNPWQLLTPPTQPESAAISAKQLLILATTLGLMLGIATALLVDKMNNVVYSSEELKEATNLPLIGEIPTYRKNKLHFWESLRSLYTNIGFLSFDAPVRSLAIISPSSGDGRSTIALHLAQTIAAMGQRVLLVDADLRHPKLHKMLDLPNGKGLSNVIAEEMNFREAIQRSAHDVTSPDQEETREADNLFVLTAGLVPPNPTSLLSSQRMQQLAAQFQMAFDFVIYDTPSLLGYADGKIMAAHADASILVVGLGKTRSSNLEKAAEELKISGASVLGLIANSAR